MPWGREACEPQLLSPSSRARQRQRLKAAHLEPELRNERSHSNERSVHGHEEQSPLTAARERLCKAAETQCSHKFMLMYGKTSTIL